MIFIGIDVGKMGSISYLVNNDLKVIPTPLIDNEYDISEMNKILENINNIDIPFCIIERAQSMPKQGTVSMFNFGKGFGIWLGLLVANNIPFQIIHSRVWTKKMLEGAPGEGKERSYNVARHLFPQWQPKFKKEYQYSDSILLAEYARRMYGKTNG